MERVNQILAHHIYNDEFKKLIAYEKDRVFCNHTIEHFLDVSRIAYIQVLEQGLNYSKDIIYAIGLLHDIGRGMQYEKNIPHHIGSVIIAKEILKDIDFSEDEVNIILQAIECHRQESDGELSKIVYISDKLSRNCFSCKAEKQCNWPKEKKNLQIKY